MLPLRNTMRLSGPTAVTSLLCMSIVHRAMSLMPKLHHDQNTTSSMISNSLRAALPGLLDDTQLTPIKFDYNDVEQRKKVVEDTAATISLRQVAQQQAGSAGSLLFVVRRPGCVLCREHGQQLAAVADTDLKDFALWAIIKETGVDDEGLVEFHDKYFSYPIYKDAERAVYKAFGSRRIGLSTWNPLRLYRGYKELGRRLKHKKVEGNYKGEGLIQGGLLLFDKEGNLMYSYDEQVGTEFDMESIVGAAKQVASGEAASVGATASKEEL